jgi:hypothetical protein
MQMHLLNHVVCSVIRKCSMSTCYVFLGKCPYYESCGIWCITWRCISLVSYSCVISVIAGYIRYWRQSRVFVTNREKILLELRRTWTQLWTSTSCIWLGSRKGKFVHRILITCNFCNYKGHKQYSTILFGTTEL